MSPCGRSSAVDPSVFIRRSGNLVTGSHLEHRNRLLGLDDVLTRGTLGPHDGLEPDAHPRLADRGPTLWTSTETAIIRWHTKGCREPVP